MPLLNHKLNENEKNSLKSFHDQNTIYIAEVMDTRSPLKNGDIKVWILNSNTDKELPSNWIIAHSTFQIGTTLKNNALSISSFENQATAFGSWNPIPYVGNYVFIFYPQTTDTSTAPYWFGSPNLLPHKMLPGIPYDLNTSNMVPVCDNSYKSAENVQLAPYTPLQEGLKLQGLDNDRLRGISTSSSFRDNPSHCYGFLSPLGNQMVIDDGWSTGDSNINWINDPRKDDNDDHEKDDYGEYYSKKKWIASIDKNDKENKLNRFHGGFRFRTRNGTQLLILDCGNIYMINKDGSAWAELSEDGYIDCYSKKGISAASDGDINLHGDNINIEALNKISMKAPGGISIDTDANVMVQSATMNVSSRISVPYILSDQGQIGVFKSPSAQITGIFAGTLQGTAFYATSAGVFPMEQPYPEIEPTTSDAVVVTENKNVKSKVGSGDIYSIASRVPTHEPWGGHDKNENIPPLKITQVIKKEEKEEIAKVTKTNQVRS